MTQKCCEHKNVLRTYPVFYQYGKYSVNLSDLSEQDVIDISLKLASLNIALTKRGYNF